MKLLKMEIKMKTKNIKTAVITGFIAILTLATPVQVQAVNGHIEIRNEVRKVEIFLNKKGVRQQREVEAVKVTPGDELLYTIYFKNTSKKAASNIVINNPVPKNMIYKNGSAFGSGTDITFSVDGGKTFAKSGKLKVKSKSGTLQPATAKDYTDIRWVFKPKLNPGDQGTVQFRANLK